ncbi:MAG: hypothetical protein U9N49_06175 [Campylobacterota bacterium]|nr:hypothetical protein [Campylobacterota bacterium]
MQKIILFLLSFLLLNAEDKIEIKRTYYESGELSSETRYVNGTREGEAMQFYPTGQLRQKKIYQNDKSVYEETFLQNGSPRSYYDNRQENIMKFKFLGNDGDIVMNHEVHQDPNDKNRATLFIKEKEYTAQFKTEKYEAIEAPKVVFKDDPTRKDGEIIEYNEKGEIESYAKVKDGTLDGEAYSDYGYYKSVDNFENGKLNGMRKRYENGILTKEVEFKDNQKSGISNEYYDDGTLKKEAFYEEGKLIGEMIEYRQDGSVKLKLVFNQKNGGMLKHFDRNKNLIKSAKLSNFAFLDDDDNKSYRDNLKLYYPNNKTYMDYNLTKGEGKLKVYYPNGKLKYLIPINKYKAQGEAKKYYQSGKLRAIIPMKKGLIEGIIRVYYPNGNALKYTLPHKKSTLSGTKIKYDRKRQKVDYNLTYSDGAFDLSKPFGFKHNDCNSTIYYENQKVEYNISCEKDNKVVTGYYQNGMQEYEIHYKKDQKHHISYLYYGNREFDEIAHLDNLHHEPIFENSIHQELKFIKDRLNGESKIYNPNGEMSKKINYKDGVREGLTTQYGMTNYGNRPTTTKTAYRDDKKDGIEQYYEEGELKRETHYKRGKKEGKEMIKSWRNKTVAYYKNDKKEGFETTYKDDDIVDGKEYRKGEVFYEVEEIINE